MAGGLYAFQPESLEQGETTYSSDEERAQAKEQMVRFVEVTSDRCRELASQLEDARELTSQIFTEIDYWVGWVSRCRFCRCSF